MLKTFITILLLGFTTTFFAQITQIPDPNFEQALIDLGIDSDGIVNGQVLTSDIEFVTDLNVASKGIQDLTGLEDFSALENLNVSFNMMTSLTLTNNINLKELIFNTSFNLLNIDISNNINLETLRSSYSLLTQLDLTNNPNLVELVLGEPSPAGNHLIEFLDLSVHSALIKLQLINLEYLSIVDLRSGSNNILTDVFVECTLDGGFNCEPFPCFMVDDVDAAQNNQFPYSEWDVMAIYSEDCTAGLNDNSSSIFTIHPNPAKNELFITAQNTTGNLKIKIFNIEGKLLSTHNLEVANQTSIDVSSLTSGICFLNIEDENGNTTIKKFVME
ncbi:T9SS type A sorting domain-containing protein [Aequorivita sp. F47161]|uniref:T9SS type A sorting domain-containing protein n=1 Tax=Aequorivita vitellina TaxID=2874475 RepID=A0A9X1QTP1_9FLAO|nr:T9SS type A sorting domain-containing protein [Aequorivita vitellina]MCG2417624.1 T9SS type A sorting domain-containing protein [Aequorivita vitellina]